MKNIGSPIGVTAAAGTDFGQDFVVQVQSLSSLSIEVYSPTGRHPSQVITRSSFRPLSNIPHCCLPKGVQAVLSPDVADQTLIPAKGHQLGKPLPYQLLDPTPAYLIA